MILWHQIGTGLFIPFIAGSEDVNTRWPIS